MKKKSFEVHDRNLWEEVARSIRPLGMRALKMSASSVSLPKQPVQILPQKTSAPKISLNKSPPPIAGFDRRTEQKLMRGKVEIESRLDLHGVGLEEARMRLLDFISHRRMQGFRLVLVITGKGASPFSGHTLHGRDHFYAPEREGRLRRQLPEWLHEAPFRAHVSGFQQAHPRHGGGGAFYVKLRRTRES
jgi:DNA-nicking Smr family endonuclease